MLGTAQQLPTYAYKAIDTVQAVTERQAAILADCGVVVVGRYLPQDDRRLEEPDPNGGDWRGCWTLSRLEARRLGAANLMIEPLQWGASGADRLCAELGHEWGTNQARVARWLGIPDGVHLWGDTEGRRTVTAGLRATVAHVEAEAAARIAAGYQAGQYFSLELPPGFTGRTMYGLRGVTAYHGAAQGDLPSPEPRGFAIRQYGLRQPRLPGDDAPRCGYARAYCPIRYGQRIDPTARPVCPLNLGELDPECFVPIGLAYDPDRITGDAYGSPVFWAPGR